ncbi:MAG: NAD-dependent epimerase/dehydratase [Candidatus Scalindua rubra]|uniref:UDP-glucuronate decarboxylase n=1 Tax=Candidatus Scalindua rubra TaxID=1872076 RepID=A0A1E3X2Y1_9BACT|nr:MAG: NAD-dependent epimerase/dehydratase [Candidatus Scalindua rubra]
MKVLITGGAGFIGSHLAEACLNQSNEVYIIDDLSTGSIRNIEHLKSQKHFHYVIDSILNRPLTAELIDAADLIFHLAAAVGVRLIIESPVRTIETNIKGTELVLDLASKKKKRVVITSTSEVYGKSSNEMFSENDDLILGPTHKARWSYAASKLVDEFLALAYYREKQVPVIIVRLFNTVGPRQTGRYGMVIPRFVGQAITEEPITVYGDGQQTRTFLHVKDAVSAMTEIVKNQEAWGEIFNIGVDNDISVLSLAEMVKENLNSNSEIVFIPYEQAYEEGFEDMRRRKPDISKIQKHISFYPQFSLQDVIADVAEDQRGAGF